MLIDSLTMAVGAGSSLLVLGLPFFIVSLMRSSDTAENLENENGHEGGESFTDKSIFERCDELKSSFSFWILSVKKLIKSSAKVCEDTCDGRGGTAFTESIHKREDNHYEMPLPFREVKPVMPCNKKLAERRLNQLKGRFKKDAKYKEDYVRFMQKMLEDGHAEVAPKDHGTVWYIPHHGVYHPKKPDKIRVVFA